jgi:D-aminoacyl-tRNA deacylase
MKVLLQRVKNASVTVNDRKIASIGRGLLLLVGIKEDDTDENIKSIFEKICGLRVFEDKNGKFDLSVSEIKGEILLVPQFTLYGDCSRGRRPDFTAAAPVEKAKKIYEDVVGSFKKTGLKVENGVFQAHMEVSLVNDGPVTLMLEK